MKATSNCQEVMIKFGIAKVLEIMAEIMPPKSPALNPEIAAIPLSTDSPPKKSMYLKVVGSRGMVDVQRGRIQRCKENGELAESLTRENGWPSASTSQIDYFCRVIRGEKENIVCLIC